MIYCRVSLKFRILFQTVGVSLYVATEIFSWSCIFTAKHATEPLNFKILLRLICSIPLLQNTRVKRIFGHFLVLSLFAWLGLKILVSIMSKT